MRMHISLDDELVREIDELVGRRGRNAFIVEAVRQKVDVLRHWERIEAALPREPISEEMKEIRVEHWPVGE